MDVIAKNLIEKLFNSMKKFAFILVILIFAIPSYLSNEIVVENGESIQEAIDSAMEGDVIIINEGIYHENLFINKSISLKGNGKVIIDGGGKTAVTIKKEGVRIENIYFTNSNNFILYAKNSLIQNCTFYSGKYGIISYGSVIQNCTFYKCGRGILLTKDNIFQKCHIFKCGIGIEINGKRNEIKNCSIHTCGVGIYMENSTNNFVEKSNIYKNNNNEGGIFLLNSSYNVINRCNVSYGSFGVRIMKSSHNSIISSRIFKNRYGVKMEYSQENEVKRCIIMGNRFGLTIENCKNILIEYNDITKNYMYSIDAKYSICDARYNWWGSFIPKKVHTVMSRVKYFPWLLNPLFGHKCIYNENLTGKREYGEEKDFTLKNMTFVSLNDFDPMVDVKVGMKIKRARNIGEEKRKNIEIFIEGNRNKTSFKGDKILNYTAWQNVDDEKQNIEIDIKIGLEKKHIVYDMARGEWYGDDFIGDADGYGHIKFNDAEIWFDIFYNDYDRDGLNYYEEVYIYGTNPAVSDYGKDYDGDGLPIQWEDKYGFNDFVKENHTIDYDGDGLDDYEEYYVFPKFSDPFAKDIFIEVDVMEGYEMYNESIQMLYDAFTFHNINLHIFVDEKIPYRDRVYYNDAVDIYWKYFLDENISSLKHGIYHYAIIVSYSSSKRGGHAFVGYENLDSFLLAGEYINKWRKGESRKIAYASLFMHEFGHTLGIFDDTFGGVDNESCNAPWLAGYWKYRNYKSCMNYRYAFQLVDYSDGSHGINDFDDWQRINLKFFKESFYYSSI
ncbi:MAG TPA: hypothetical protein ENI52_04350 [Thermoplasmata archaeon]|nr:hypothetical protein [Thermoplasmata archaeon]